MRGSGLYVAESTLHTALQVSFYEIYKMTKKEKKENKELYFKDLIFVSVASTFFSVSLCHPIDLLLTRY